jgi:hypothetical protein
MTEQRAFGLREVEYSPVPPSDLTASDREAPFGEVPTLGVEKPLRLPRYFLERFAQSGQRKVLWQIESAFTGR